MNSSIKRYFFYKPAWNYLILDIVLLLFAYVLVLQCFPLSTPAPFEKYYEFLLVFSLFWLFYAYLSHRFISPKYLKLWAHIRRLMLNTATMWVTSFAYTLLFPEQQYSIYVISSVLAVVFLTNFAALLLIYAYRYAVNIEPDLQFNTDRAEVSVQNPPQSIDQQSRNDIQQTIIECTSKHVFERLSRRIDFFSTNTSFFSTDSLFNFQKLIYYRFDTIVNLMPLNRIRGINRMLATINDKLPDNGTFVCCFETQSTHKKKILSMFPVGVNYMVYMIDFVIFRILPKVLVTSRLYFDITGGKRRVLSKAEVLGRLYYCGFEVECEQKIDGMTYVFARRKSTPATVINRIYGPFIILPRKGKNAREIKVYKMRTMHPYSEFLQEYIYQKNSLQAGGKFNRDIRVTSLGRFMRKYWIDELPMIFNLFKGNMKIVGVRPLSKHYFSLYSKELQEKRVLFKPGLLPPFYVDMPKTLEEIEASELKYLNACADHGVLRTDFLYFWRILNTIIIKKARSK